MFRRRLTAVVLAALVAPATEAAPGRRAARPSAVPGEFAHRGDCLPKGEFRRKARFPSRP